ncbi:MAG: TspO/MBR family protein [Candidatus Anstonellales archaeon]
MQKINTVSLAASLLLCLFAGAFGSIFTLEAIPTWYSSLNKPWFSPPDWVFGPVWTVLYILMGASLYLLWEGKRRAGKEIALALFVLQLLLNALWSFAFFGLRSPLLGLVDIGLLDLSLALTIAHSYKISKGAAYLLIPYMLWVSFATLLNLSIYLIN